MKLAKVLVALNVVLSLSALATPAAADDGELASGACLMAFGGAGLVAGVTVAAAAERGDTESGISAVPLLGAASAVAGAAHVVAGAIIVARAPERSQAQQAAVALGPSGIELRLRF